MDLFSDWDIENNDWYRWIKDNDWLPYLYETHQKALVKSASVFPKTKQILRAWQLTPLEKIKVVIIGQDPYHGINQANGLAFSVNKEVKLPPSLRNIFSEVRNEYPQIVLNHGDLTNWANQGVFLMNTILTVAEGTPLEHQSLGWEKFTTDTIMKISESKKHVVFMLWGKQAQSFETLINSSHLVLKSVHPSPLSAHRGFFGNQHFLKTNDFLLKNRLSPIDWSLH